MNRLRNVERRLVIFSLIWLSSPALMQLPRAGAQASAVAAGAVDEDLSALRLKDEEPALPVTPERTISLQDSFDRAVERNREVLAARYNLPAMKAAIQIAGAVPNPRFSLLYGFGPAFTIIIAGNPQQFGFQQQIQTGGKRSKQVLVAKANYGLSRLQLEAILFAVHNRVRRAYAELAAAEAYADLTEAERKVALDLVRVAEARYAAGKSSRSDVLQAQLGVLQFDTQRNQAQARLQQASAALALLIGEKPQRTEVIDVDDNGIFKLSAARTDLVPAPSSTLPALPELLPVGYRERPDLKLSIQQAFADRKAVSLARAQRLPDLFVDCGYQFSTFRRNQPYGLSGVPVPNEPGVYLNSNTTLPLFYRQQGEVGQAKVTVEQDQLQIEQIQAQIAADIVTAYQSVVLARANIARFQKAILPASVEVARLARLRYRMGKGDLGSAILARQQYQQTLSSYFDAVVAYQNAWADLEQSVGVPLKL